jgi:mono/diheme cytochrome c family protein
MDRLIIKSIEGRILAGISMFVAIMILIGWVAINEEARMAAFREQHQGRAIERGAELFAANCSTCHGTDGLGIGGYAPALNNPHFFGYDPLAQYNATITNAERIIDGLNAESELLMAEFTDSENVPSVERQDEILARLEEIDAALVEQTESREGAIAERETALIGLQNAVDLGLYPRWDEAETDEELTAYLAQNGTRLSQVGWAGDLHSYVVTTLIHGRPGSANYWGSAGMASWSQRSGGALRDDQIEDLTAYILNWDKGSEWTAEDVFSVKQFAKPLADGSIPTGPGPETIGTDVTVIMERLATDGLVGDAANGESLYTGALGCSACHLNGAAAPDTAGTWTRVQEERLAVPQFEGYTGEQYLIESIVLPNAYVVDGYAGNMPMTFGDTIEYQELADILAFLKSQS